MEILDLSVNENLDEWGIKRTSKQKNIVISNEAKEYEVYKIPIDILTYNLNNGRMFMEVKRLENEENKDLANLKKSDPKSYNDEIENIIWSTNEERNLATKRDIESFGQMEPGVVLDEGTVIDGNRRFTCLRRLHREHPDDERFNYFLAAIIKVDGKKITNKLLKEYELRVQFGVDEKVPYSVINKNMSIYKLIEEDSFDYNTIADLLGNDMTPGKINKICKTCKLVEEFLEYINKENEYQIAEDMKVYWPLEVLSDYLSRDSKNLSALELETRKRLFFDYLLTLDLSLMTQNLRDGLIKKIFKNNDETNDLITQHKNIVGDTVINIIDGAQSASELIDALKNYKESQTAKKDKENYENKLNKLSARNQLDIPLSECKRAKECLENVNVRPLVKASNPIAEGLLSEIEKVLADIVNQVDTIRLEITQKDE